MPYLDFCPAVKKCYLMSVGTAKTTYNESFKDNDCSIAIQIAIVLFRHIHVPFFTALPLWFSVLSGKLGIFMMPGGFRIRIRWKIPIAMLTKLVLFLQLLLSLPGSFVLINHKKFTLTYFLTHWPTLQLLFILFFIENIFNVELGFFAVT